MLLLGCLPTSFTGPVFQPVYWCSKMQETPEDVLFIDASQHFEKVKNQNVLRDADIDKIISTYRNRTEEAKYSNA